MHKTTLSLMISALVVAGTAVAGDEPGEERGMEARAEAESQSRLSLGTVRALGSATAFAKVDANGDNVVSESEAQAMQGLPQQFGKLDADGDGNLTMREFASLSKNNSGTRGRSTAGAVDAETGVGLGVNADSEGVDQERSGAGTEVEGEATASLKVEDISRTNAVQAFNNVDADGNFKLDQNEAARIKGLESQFAELDKDGDGALDYAEFNAVTSVNVEGRKR